MIVCGGYKPSDYNKLMGMKTCNCYYYVQMQRSLVIVGLYVYTLNMNIVIKIPNMMQETFDKLFAQPFYLSKDNSAHIKHKTKQNKTQYKTKININI